MGRLRYIVASIWNEESNHGQRLHRLALFLVWQAWKKSVRRPVTATLFNGMRLRVSPDCDVSPAALYYRLPNSPALSLVRRSLHGGTFIDIGANIGLVTLLVADKVSHALLFEPNPIASGRAAENLRMNGLAFQVFPLALSDTVGVVEFENSGSSSENRTVDGFTTTAPTITVPRTTFDDFLREHPLASPVDAVKIDVEGHENSVLRGMKDFLKNHRPKLVMFEYLARTDIVQTLAMFHEVGFLVFELTDGGNRPVLDKTVKPLQDLFACPSERAAEFGLSSVQAKLRQPASHSPKP